MSTASLDRPGLLAEGSRLRNLLQARNAVLVAIVALIGFLTLVPLIFLINDTFTENGAFTLEAFRRAYAGGVFWEILKTSAIYATGSTILAMTVGTFFAYMVVRTDVRFKSFFIVCSIVPIIVPGILYVIAWVILGSGRSGIINRITESLFGRSLFDVFSMPGMIVVQGLDSAALVFLLMYAGFRSMDPSMEESARMSGASLPKVVARITLAVNRPALYAALLLTIIRSLESFEVPTILGLQSGNLVFTSEIWEALQAFPPDYGVAGAHSITLFLLVSVGIYLYHRGQSSAKKFATVSGKGFRPQQLPLGAWRTPMTAVMFGYCFLAVLLPLFALVFMSTQSFIRPPDMDALRAASFENYSTVLHSEGALTAFKNSLVLAVSSATITMVIVSISSWIVVRSKVKGAWIVDNLAFLPLVIPGLVLGVALIFVYARLDIGVYGTLWILLIAFVTKGLPMGIRASTASLVQISKELEESAEMSGATWWQTFRRVLVPLLMPGLLAGWVFIFIVMLRELSTSILIYPPGGQVLSVQIWDLYNRGLLGPLAALGVLMITLTAAVVVVAQRFGAKFGLGA